MIFNFLNNLNSTKEENLIHTAFVEFIDDLREKIGETLFELNLAKTTKGELYYVYSYSPEKIYITKQNSNNLELLEGVSEDFKRNLAEGFVLRFKDGKYWVDEELTDKSMNFELDFDNYKDGF